MRLLGILVIAIAVGLVAARRHAESSEPPASKPVWSAPRGGRTPAPLAPPRPAPVQQRGLATTDPAYDAVAYINQEAGALDAKELYLGEPRDPKFAPIFEKRMDAAVKVALDELKLKDGVRAVHVDCRTLSCSTTIEAAPGTDVRDLYNELNGVILGDMQEPGIDTSDPEHPMVTIYNVFRPGSRDDAGYQQIIDKGMRPSIEYTKQRLGSDKAHEAIP